MDKIKGAFFENLPVFQFFRGLFSSKLWYNSLARHTCLSRGCDDFYFILWFNLRTTVSVTGEKDVDFFFKQFTARDLAN